MEPQTQAQIDGLIQFIEDAENPATVTNEIVAAVLKYLMNKAKEVESLDIDSRINQLSSILNTLVSGNAKNTIESFNEVIGFLAGVTDEETLSGLLLSLRNDIEGKTQKAGDGRLDPREAPVLMLDSMGPTLDSVGSTSTVLHVATQGDYVYSASTIKYYKTYKGYGDSGNEIVSLGPPQQGLIYCNKKTGLQYRWAGSDTGWVQVGGDRVRVINDLTTGGTIDALSAEQGKALKAMIEGLDVNSDTRIGVVDTPSDTVLAAPSARMVKEIYLNLRALFDPVKGLAGIAFLDDKPEWKTVDIPEHTITLGTMSNVSASLDGAAINGSTSAEEGMVTILLTPSSNNYMSSISIKDADNHDVDFTRNDVSGGTEITFILYGNVTISASASSGIQVNVSVNGITSYSIGVMPSTAVELTIDLPAHHTWGTVAITYGNDDITSQCDISQASNADKVITLPNNLSDMSKVISIVANAVEDDFAVVTFGSLTNVTIKRGSTPLESGNHVYAGETISILPVGNNKVIATVSIGSTAATLQGDTYNGFTYTIGSNDVSSVGTSIAIEASAEAKTTKSVSWSGTGFKLYNAASGGSELTNPQSVYENDTFEAWVVADSSYTIDPSTGVSFSPSTGASYNSTTGKITINNVLSDVVVTVNAITENRIYRGVWPEVQDKTHMHLHIGEAENALISPLLKLSDFGSPSTLTFCTNGSTSTKYRLLFYSDEVTLADYYSQNQSDGNPYRTVTFQNSNLKYVRLIIAATQEMLDTAYIIKGEYDTSKSLGEQDFIWRGSNENIASAGTPDDFMNSRYFNWPANDKGDYVNWTYIAPNSSIGNNVVPSQNISYNSQLYGSNVKLAKTSMVRSLVSYNVPWVLGRKIELPAVDQATNTRKYDVRYGSLSEDAMPTILLYGRENDADIYSFHRFPTSYGDENGVVHVEEDPKYTHAQVVCTTTAYNNGDVFVRDVNGNTDIWGDSGNLYTSQSE